MSRLLLLEDDISLIDGLEYSLEKNGFDLEVVRTVREARKSVLKEGAYDLLLLDITLPDGTGFHICSRADRRFAADRRQKWLSARGGGEQHQIAGRGYRTFRVLIQIQK